MQLSRGLYLNLYGVMRGEKVSRLPKGNHSSIRIKKEKSGNSALIKFLEKEDGNWDPPLEELSEKDMSYFLVQVVNTFSGAQLLVRVNGKEKEVKTNKKDINYCFVRGNAQVLRYDRKRKYLEIYHVNQFTVENKKKIVPKTIFEGWAENTKELVKEFPVLAQFKNEIEKLIDSAAQIQVHKKPLAQKLNLEEALKNKVTEKPAQEMTFSPPNPKEVNLKKSQTPKRKKRVRQKTEKRPPNRKKVVLKKEKEKEAEKEILEALKSQTTIH